MAQKYIYGHQSQARSRVIRYFVWIGILLLVGSTVQVCLLSRFRILGVVPDLMLCLVMCLSFWGGRQLGAICGIAAGVLVESMGAHGIVLLPLFYFFCGYLTGHYARTVARSFVTYAAYFAVFLPLRSAVTVLYACLSYQSVHLPSVLIQTVLPEILMTAALGALLYYPMIGFYRLLEPRTRRKEP